MNTDKNKIPLEKLIKFYDKETSLEEIWLLVSDDNNYIDIYVADSFSFEDRSIGIYFDDEDSRNVSEVLEAKYEYCEPEFIVCMRALEIVKGKHLYINIYTNSRTVIDTMDTHFYSLCYKGYYKELVELEKKFVIVNWIHVKTFYDPTSKYYNHNVIEAIKLADNALKK